MLTDRHTDRMNESITLFPPSSNWGQTTWPEMKTGEHVMVTTSM